MGGWVKLSAEAGVVVAGAVAAAGVYCSRFAYSCNKILIPHTSQPAVRAPLTDLLSAWRRDYAEVNAEYVKHWSLLPARSTTHGAPAPPLRI